MNDRPVEPPKKKQERTKKMVDWELLEKICQYKVTLKDAADMMNMGKDTLILRIREEHDLSWKEYREVQMAHTRYRLQNKAIEMAMNGSNAMMIFCLKNLCEWVDRVEQKIEGNVTLESLVNESYKPVDYGGDDSIEVESTDVTKEEDNGQEDISEG